jgi:hypothetical protein
MKNGEHRFYHIIVEGEIDPSWSDWFQGFRIQPLVNRNGECLSVLSGAVVDQAALRGILNKIWDLNLALVSVNRAGEG